MESIICPWGDSTRLSDKLYIYVIQIWEGLASWVFNKISFLVTSFEFWFNVNLHLIKLEIVFIPKYMLFPNNLFLNALHKFLRPCFRKSAYKFFFSGWFSNQELGWLQKERDVRARHAGSIFPKIIGLYKQVDQYNSSIKTNGAVVIYITVILFSDLL